MAAPAVPVVEIAAARPARAESRLDVRVCRSWAELEAHRPDWERLLEASPAASIFATPEWLGAWWAAFAPAERLRALLFFDGAGELAGLAPLYEDVVSGPAGFAVRRLRLVGDGSNDSDNLDFVVRPGAEAACAEAFLSWVGRESGAALCELNTLPSDSATADALRRGLNRRGWVDEVSTRPRLVIPLPESWDAYLAGLSRDERWRIVSQERRLEAKYRIAFRRCAEQGQLEQDLDTLFRLHQKRWERRGGPGTFASEARRHFYHDVARRLLSRGWLEFWLMEVDGRPLAAQFCFRYRDTVHLLQEGFDPDYSKDRLGAALRARVLREAIARGARRYDFLAGDDPSKRRWGPELAEYLDLHFALPASRGGFYLRARRGGRAATEWLRGHVPPAVFAAARRTYRALRGPAEAR